MRGQMGGDKEEARAEYHESYGHRALGPERCPGSRRETVLLRYGAEPDQVASQEEGEMQGAEAAAGE